MAAGVAPPWSEGGDTFYDGRLRWRSRGDGPPLVLLHKLGGWIDEWAALAQALPDRCVIALDLPGHGGGAGAPPHIQRVEDSSARVIATLGALGIDRFALCGSSLGGAVAVAMAAALPARVQALVLISVALTDAATPAQMRQADLKGDGVLYGPGDAPIDRSPADATRLFGMTDPALSETMNRSRAAAGPWVRASWRGVNLADVRGRLPSIAAPTLLIYGENGGSGYEAYQRVGLTQIGNARAVHVAGAGAFTHQDQPERTAAAIASFLGA